MWGGRRGGANLGFNRKGGSGKSCCSQMRRTCSGDGNFALSDVVYFFVDWLLGWLFDCLIVWFWLVLVGWLGERRANLLPHLGCIQGGPLKKNRASGARHQ